MTDQSTTNLAQLQTDGLTTRLTFVPLRGLIKEKHDVFRIIDLELLLYCLVFL